MILIEGVSLRRFILALVLALAFCATVIATSDDPPYIPSAICQILEPGSWLWHYFWCGGPPW